MSEKETQETSQGSSDETKNTENNQEELTIPKSRFDEVNNTKKELEEKLAEAERRKEAEEKKKLEEEGKLKELTDQLKAENESLKLDGLKRDLVQEAITSNKLKPQLAKMVTGNSEEEIKNSLDEAIKFNEELLADLKENKTASDDSGVAGNKKESPMSAEDWMKMYKEDPDKANEYLREQTGTN